MAATIHYLKSHYRGYRVRPHASKMTYEVAERRDTVFNIGMLAMIIVFIVIGVWLVSGVASMGRGNTDCLQSARKVCGILPHGPWSDRFG
jgi:hypothetical protein